MLTLELSSKVSEFLNDTYIAAHNAQSNPDWFLSNKNEKAVFTL